MSESTVVYIDKETRDILKAQAKENGMTLKGYLHKLAKDAEKINNIVKGQ